MGKNNLVKGVGVVHEMSVIEALVEQVRAHVPVGGDDARGVVKRVCIEVGSLEHLDDAIMELGWRASVMDGEMADAELVIEHVGMVVRCGSCGKEYEPIEPACLFCPDCGCAQPIVLKGKGVVLTSIEIEDGEGGEEALRDQGTEERQKRTANKRQ